jgi:lipoprotein-releasing system ATP-binding protein
VLRGLDLAVERGEMVAVVGASGVGKSTLLHLLGGLDRSDSGSIRIGDTDIGGMADEALASFRNAHVGFVFQFHHLLPEFTALDNIVLPQRAAGRARGPSAERAAMLLAAVGLAERASHRPAELSGGEQQRVAIARALANAPRLLLADEPTGNLDPETAGHVFDMLIGLVRGTKLAALIATHNLDLAARMDRTYRLDAGRIVPG